MFGKLLPRTTDFYAFFEKHIAIVLQAVEKLAEMVPCLHQEHEKQAEAIAVLEKQADNITHQCIETLHKTFITPFERNDIYRLITHMDDILDLIEDVAARIVTYKMDTRQHEIQTLVTILMSAVKALQGIIAILRTSKLPKDISQPFVIVHTLENEGDKEVRRLIGKLFDEEKDPFALIKWKEVYENLEEAIDYCQSVSNIIEGVMIENS